MQILPLKILRWILVINVSTNVFTGHSRHPSSARGVVNIWNLPHFYPIFNASVVWLVLTGTCIKSLPNVILRFCQLKHIYLLKFLLVSPTYHLKHSSSQESKGAYAAIGCTLVQGSTVALKGPHHPKNLEDWISNLEPL